MDREGGGILLLALLAYAIYININSYVGILLLAYININSYIGREKSIMFINFLIYFEWGGYYIYIDIRDISNNQKR